MKIYRVHILLISMMLVGSTASISAAQPYSITQISTVMAYNVWHQINDKGQAVWTGGNDVLHTTDFEIYFYNGTSTVQITNNYYLDQVPQINNKGHLAWQACPPEGSCQIWVYDGATSTKVSSDDWDNGYPQISDSGNVVWYGDIWVGEYELVRAIFLYDGTETTIIAETYEDNYYESPQINDYGEVVWLDYCDDGPCFKIFDGTTVSLLTAVPPIWPIFERYFNNNRQVVWASGYGVYKEIYFFDGTAVIQLTDNYLEESPFFDLNDNGWVVYTNSLGLWLYDGFDTVLVSTGAYPLPRINNFGEIVFNDDYYNIMVYDGTNIIQVTDNSYINFIPKINDRGEIVWRDVNIPPDNGMAIFLARPAVQMVDIDIKPGICDNRYNIKSRGFMKVAILGTEDFDVNDIDPETIRLAGVPPLKWAVRDIIDASACSKVGYDGTADLSLKFDTQEIVSAAAALGKLSDGYEVVLPLTGALHDGTPIRGIDSITFMVKGKAIPWIPLLLGY